MSIVVHLERGGTLGVVGPLDAVVELFEQPRCGGRDGLVDLAELPAVAFPPEVDPSLIVKTGHQANFM